MPRQTRAERRARRQQQAEDQAGGAQRALARQQHVRPAEPARAEAPPKRHERGGLLRFVGESWGELQKVEWPTQRHVIQGTVVVLVACIIVGTYLWVADVVSKYVVENILIK